MRMKGAILAIVFALLHVAAPAQFFTVAEFENLLHETAKRQENFLKKKGFEKQGGFNTGSAVFEKKEQIDLQWVVRSCTIRSTPLATEIVLTTPYRQEAESFLQRLQTAGYFAPQPGPNTAVLYQLREIAVYCNLQTQDRSSYQLRAVKKNLPEAKNLLFAEDLLQLTTHEHLAAVFGAANVKRDVMYFSDVLKKNCSIIFPNTNRQAVFIWKDDNNYCDIDYLIIGAQLGGDATAEAIPLSAWRSAQGVYCGMSLNELVSLNQSPISFYNWRTADAGFLTTRNKGQIDFSRIKPVLNCLNCGFLPIATDREVIQSGYALNENQKVYVGSYVVVPLQLESALSLKH